MAPGRTGGAARCPEDPTPLTNRLATHLTTWKAWYAIPAMIAFTLASSVMLIGGLVPVEDKATRDLINGLLVPVRSSPSRCSLWRSSP